MSKDWDEHIRELAEFEKILPEWFRAQRRDEAAYWDAIIAQRKEGSVSDDPPALPSGDS